MKIDKYFKAHKLAQLIKDIVNGDNMDNSNFENLIRDNKYANEFLNDITDSEIFKANCDEIKNEALFREKNIELLNMKIKRRILRRRFISRISYAASAVAVIALFFVVFQLKDIFVNRDNIITHNSGMGVTLNVPTLILENGEKIDLTTKENKIITKGYIIEKKTKGGLIYNHQTNKDSVGIFKSRLLIPYKQTYNLVLEDGTEVFLNARSELIYPNKFIDSVREVELVGEAFFKVSKSNIPFVVKTKDASIRVYGTEFNVNTIHDRITKTILVNGSVGVTFAENKEVMMTPNDMLTIDFKSGKYEVNKVDTHDYLGWMDGMFRFKNTRLDSVLKELSAWYGIEFHIKKEHRDILLNMLVPRDKNIDELLNTIEVSLNLRFIKEGGDKYTLE